MFGYRNEGVGLGHASSAGVKLGRTRYLSFEIQGQVCKFPQVNLLASDSVIKTTFFLPSAIERSSFFYTHSLSHSLLPPRVLECCTLSLTSLIITFPCYHLNSDCVRRF